jgi:hypothetical protein
MISAASKRSAPVTNQNPRQHSQSTHAPSATSKVGNSSVTSDINYQAGILVSSERAATARKSFPVKS